jgi:hypothetical protein
MIMSKATLVLAAAVSVARTVIAEPVDTVPAALRACASVQKDSERLACYDLTIERLSPEAAAPISAHVAALRHAADGALVIDLDNGQQWLQLSGSSSPLLEIGHEVTVTRAALNSFRMSTPSGRALKVKRVK